MSGPHFAGVWGVAELTGWLGNYCELRPVRCCVSGSVVCCGCQVRGNWVKGKQVANWPIWKQFKLFIFCVYTHHGTHVEVRGQHARFASPSHEVCSESQTRVLRLGGRCKSSLLPSNHSRLLGTNRCVWEAGMRVEIQAKETCWIVCFCFRVPQQLAVFHASPSPHPIFPKKFLSQICFLYCVLKEESDLLGNLECLQV